MDSLLTSKRRGPKFKGKLLSEHQWKSANNSTRRAVAGGYKSYSKAWWAVELERRAVADETRAAAAAAAVGDDDEPGPGQAAGSSPEMEPYILWS
jgi:hypothetical protein